MVLFTSLFHCTNEPQFMVGYNQINPPQAKNTRGQKYIEDTSPTKHHIAMQYTTVSFVLAWLTLKGGLLPQPRAEGSLMPFIAN